VRGFVLDANVFIEASRRYYPFDVCPGFWRALILQCKDKRIRSIDRVEKELHEGKDQLSRWAKESAPEGFFKKTADRAVIERFKEMVGWVHSEAQYAVEAKKEFADVADGWVVAYATSNALVVVTQEVYNREIKTKVPVPNACRQFGVEYVNTFDMLRELGIKLVLGKLGK
jgi:hypothetical protein